MKSIFILFFFLISGTTFSYCQEIISSSNVAGFSTAGERDLFIDENNVLYVGLRNGGLRIIGTGTISNVSGTSPIVVASGTTNPVISITRNNIVSGTSLATATTPLALDAGATNAVVGGANATFTINNTAPLWNANQIQGRIIDTTTPTDRQLLTWDAITSTWKPDGYTVATITATTYTLLASDHGKILDFTATTAITLTVPNALTTGFQVSITQANTGVITFVAGAGMIINNRWNGTKTAGRWAKAGIEVRASGSSILSGDVL